MSHVPPPLYVALAEAVPDLHVHCVDPWCLIGSAAALLAGADTGVADVDVLASPADAGRLEEAWASRRERGHAPAAADCFRSRFARYRFPGLPVEVMGGLELFADGAWRPVRPGRLMLVGVDGLAVPVPAVAEQVRLLEGFGRDKDLRRAAALRSLLPLPAGERAGVMGGGLP
ncbi:hypothetical protein C7456_101211 [Fulvimonas soli]|jgi:hypothetical protein|uniref:Uncharacterized protein n=1 Tax=Fulvimonas soli TaxID=155197 RepID=A0A316IIF6_9GAMM|nr:hypothetical protein [Fulvimonas soli]PWK92873.1 hypothetical protein C7456_101211 [Fulvimonas soli]